MKSLKALKVVNNNIVSLFIKESSLLIYKQVIYNITLFKDI
jgi:hypothetical protein